MLKMDQYTIDFLTLFGAFAAVLVSAYSVHITKNTAKQSEIEENKRAKAAIDANLTAAARIEWIQDVRQATVDLITACYKYIGAKEDERQKDW